MMKSFFRVFVGVVVLTTVFSAAASELPPITATYRVERKQGDAAGVSTFEWTLRRSPSCVAADDERARVSEQWRRDDAGRIWYQRIFHKEKKVIEYQPADLGIGGVESKWSRIASVIEPAELDGMQLQEQTVGFEGRTVFVYRGTRQTKLWAIQWLEAEQIPARISVGEPGEPGYYSLALLSMRRESSDLNFCGGDLTSYETIDFADIGDRQGDPFITALMKYEGFSPGHRH
jgi:hypothetical protein